MPAKKNPSEPISTRKDAVVTVVGTKLIVIRGQPVIADSDLAAIYGVETKALNRAVSRNHERFPTDFSFTLDRHEWENLKRQFGTSSSVHGGRRNPPRVFTEHGDLMASTVLRSDAAIRMSTFIIRAFVKMREELASNREFLRRLAEIDKSLIVHDAALRDLYQKLLPLLAPPPATTKREMGFHTQP